MAGSLTSVALGFEKARLVDRLLRCDEFTSDRAILRTWFGVEPTTAIASAPMCGIVGLITKNEDSRESLRQSAERMSESIRYRGPDDSGSWVDESGHIALGFRRLAIIDLTEDGHQPMRSASGRFMIVFNGEVFNYVELRAELEKTGARFRGHSDTEVILAAFECWGIEDAVQRFIGMFAMAVWDASTRTLSLIRDRLGIKPLYYSRQNGRVTFASELRGIMTAPGFSGALNESALNAYLRYLYIPAPDTIFKDVHKLLPGHILRVNLDLAGAEPNLSKPYWSVDSVYAQAQKNPFEGTEQEAVSELRRLLQDVVSLRMRSDVPVGALLSGGVDSSTVVGLMQCVSTRPVRTFTIGFPGTVHDESTYAAQVAERLGTQHTHLPLTGQDALDVVPQLPEVFDEPFADPSLIPTYLVSKLARQDVTVALTGDGGDELFAGYERYVQGERLIRAAARAPHAVRAAVGAVIRKGTVQTWDRAYEQIARITGNSGRQRLAGQKIRKLGDMLAQKNDGRMYGTLLSVGWQDAGAVRGRRDEAMSSVDRLLTAQAGLSLVDRMQLIDLQTYLPDDLLAKVDRASMAVSLEARVPLLDHRVVEFSWRLPHEYKIRNGRGKWILKEVVRGMIGDDLVDRPKVGFSVPIAQWLRGPLKGYAEDLMFASASDGVSLFDSKQLRSSWSAFQAGADENALALWSVLMFDAWKQRWL